MFKLTMAKALIKNQAIQLRREGKSLTQIAAITGLSRPTIVKACKENSAEPPKAVGRPRLEAEYIDEQLISQLTLNKSVFTQTELKGFIGQYRQEELQQRSFARLLQQLGWAVQSTPSEKLPAPNINECIVEHLQDRKRNLHILLAQDATGQLWFKFKRDAPGDADYLAIISSVTSKLLDCAVIHTDILDLKYCPQIRQWQLAHPQIKIYTANSNSPPMESTTPIPAKKTISKNPAKTMNPNNALTHLQLLEAESIHIMREVVAEANNPVMLYSIGKDSAVMLHLALKAFYPAKLPFPLLHIDTKWKFQDMYRFRERMAKEHDFELLIHTNPEGLEKGINPFTHGSQIHTDVMKTQALKQALDHYQFDVAFGGARRDEEKSRAKERIFSFRNAQHHWDPKHQRPELWNLYNAKKNKGESIRAFPLSNWTELDIWQYIYLENIPIVPLYFVKKRPVVERDGALIMVDDDRMPLYDGEIPQLKSVRFRTLGCYPLTGAVESNAQSLTDIIQEMLLTKTSERQGRMIDHDSSASMEKKKQEGYF